MPSIVTQEAKTLAAQNFNDLYQSSKTLYLALSAPAAWVDDNSPPAPADTPAEIADFWTNLVGIQKIQSTNYAMVVRKVTWTSGNAYVAFVSDYGADFYAVNSSNFVYQCITAGGGNSTVEPTGHNNGADITLGDGYTWRYLYTLNTDDVAADLQSSLWMPVAYGAKMSTDQTNYGDTEPQKTLGAQHVLIKANASDASFPAGDVRQVGVIDTPLLSGGGPVTAEFALPAALTTGSGYLMSIDNISTITRSATQTETFKIIQRFF